MTPQERYPKVAKRVAGLKVLQDDYHTAGKKAHCLFKRKFTNASSLFVFSALNRALNLTDSLLDAIGKWNFIAAASLLRGILLTLATLVYVCKSGHDPTELIAIFFAESRLHKSVGPPKKIKKVPEDELVGLAEDAFPGIEKVYNETSNLVHFSSKNFFAMSQSISDKGHSLTLYLGVGNKNWSEKDILELLDNAILLGRGIIMYTSEIAQRFSEKESSFGPVVIS